MAISSTFDDTARARTRHGLLSIGLCLITLTGCSRAATDGSESVQSPPPIVPSAALPPPPTQEEVPEVPGGVLLVAKLLVESALKYDACSTCSDTGFLLSAEMLTTGAELERLERSQRAHLPWAAMQARHERSQVKIIDIQGELSNTTTWHVVATGTRTVRTSSATSRSFIQVRLTVVADGRWWKVAQTRGGGL